MTLLQNRTPVQLLWIIAASNLLAVIGFGTLALPWRFYQASHPLLLCSFIIVVLGCIGSLVAEIELKEGIASGRWPDAMITGLRRRHPAFSLFALLLIVGSVVFLITIAISDGRNFSGMWCFLYPGMSLTRLSNYLRPKPASSNNSLLKPTDTPKPLHSEHRGTPPRPFAN